MAETQGLLEWRYTVIQKSFFPVLKAKNNPSSFLFTGQTDIYIYGKNLHTLSILIKKLGVHLASFKIFFFKAVSTLLLIMPIPGNG